MGAGEFAGYASATVNHTAAHLVGKSVDRDANLASSHAAHSEVAVPRWDNEIGRAAFPPLSAGSSHGKALAAELTERDSDEADSILPLEPAEANAPPAASADADETPVNA
ncbi:MAG: hypothetical protein LC792_14910, partial [Actinobacteria bacterium]|nr:hypothetical protein [Actinomycetota bacterium]